MWRWPVKALRGETVRSAVVDRNGMAGDRVLEVFKAGSDDKLWGGSHPRMMEWEAAWPAQCGCADGTGDAPVVYEPSGAAWAADDPDLPAVMAADLGEDAIELRPHGRSYGRLLVVFEASLKRLSEQMGREIEVERFRPNVLCESDADAFAEAGFEPGSRIRLGDNDFTVQKPCERCILPSWDPYGRQRDKDLHKHIVKELDNRFGIYVRTEAKATIAVGDQISG
ncbi:MOSC domain-containing protein [Glycomyces buryatensis]|uniref:MOSC domain-containing protein n=1 Tax=Glycomyces buryatensis TaxID=2570927 RepID=A0A4S8QE19_9ACTN|nr:MOSC domain-containing protein [Glycomyces buryatensis]